MPPSKKFEDQIKNAVNAFGEPPRIIMTGKTGAGKSSLINALTGQDIAKTGVTPCTQEKQSVHFKPRFYNIPHDRNDIGSDIEMQFLDVPGFSEADKHGQRLEYIFNKIPENHLVLLVVGAPDRAFEHERQFISDIRDQEPDMPVIVVANKIDMLEPVREWDPSRLDLKHPRSPKEKNITAWSGEVIRACRITNETLACVAAGESFNDHSSQYGLEALKLQIIKALPDAAKNYAARVFNASEVKRSRALKVIWANATAAAFVGAVPFPIADVGVLCGIQVEMVVAIAFIYGIKMDIRQAAGLLGPALGFLAGPTAFQALVKYLPVAGSVVAAGTAGVMTLAIGWTYLYLFIHNNFNPSPDEVKTILSKQYKEAKNYKDQLKAEAERKRKEGEK
jgi:predicted GTPase/uncharacterized protein (DUF697 family)